MSRYKTLEDLADKIDVEGEDYFFDGYGFHVEDLPLDAPKELVDKASRLEVAVTTYRQARLEFMALLPDGES